jgi:sulfonate transport system substrate-binding protein
MPRNFFAGFYRVNALVLALGIVSAFVPFGHSQKSDPSSQVIRIGYQKYGTLVLLKARGTLEKHLAQNHIEVQWTEFPAGPQLLEGLNVGSIDFGTVGEAPPIFAQAAGADMVYIGYEPQASAGEALIVRKDSPIRNLSDLRGKKVALNKGSSRPVAARETWASSAAASVRAYSRSRSCRR